MLAVHLFDRNLASKDHDFDVMNRLCATGYIVNPFGKCESVQFTGQGIARGQDLAEALFNPENL